MMSGLATTTQRGKKITVTVVLIRWFLGGYFIYTGVNKILDPVAFLKAVHLYDMLPTEPAFFLNATAIVLPWLEVLCGVALVLGVWRRGGALVLGLMLCVFTPAILLRALAVKQADGIPFVDVAFDCGCGTGPQIIWQKLCKNGGLILLALITLLSRSDKLCLSRLFARGHASKEASGLASAQSANTGAGAGEDTPADAAIS